MTTERKQELMRLLEEALALDNLEIRNSEDEDEKMSKEDYIKGLQDYWKSYSLVELILSKRYLGDFEPYITREATQTKLLNFIRDAFKDAIHEDRIQSARSRVLGNVPSEGYPLDSLLKQFLNIAIGHDEKRAVSVFEECVKNEPASFQYRIPLAGIKLAMEVGAEMLLDEPTSFWYRIPFAGKEFVRIKTLPPPIPDFARLQIEVMGMSPHVFRAQLIFDISVSPVFFKPDPNTSDRVFRYAKHKTFGKAFCQALSLVCDSPIQAGIGWAHLEKDELFCLARSYDSYGPYYPANMLRTGKPVLVEKSQIEKTAQLCNILVNPSSNIGRKLQIPIDRWIKSKTDQEPIDQVIDLAIAFEALYKKKSQKLGSRAAKHLGENEQHEEQLRALFKQLYKYRSIAVHSGRKGPEEIQIGEAAPITRLDLIQRAQRLCRDAIMKILEDGEVPDWDDLILGE